MTKTRQRDKFVKLQAKIGFGTAEQKDNSDSIRERWVINVHVPSKELTLAVVNLLQQALNFVIITKALPVDDIVVATEEACRHLGEEKAASLWHEVAKTIKRAKPPRSNLTPDERKAILELKGDQDIMIQYHPS